MTAGNTPKEQPLKDGAATPLWASVRQPGLYVMMYESYGVHYLHGLSNGGGKPTPPVLLYPANPIVPGAANLLMGEPIPGMKEQCEVAVKKWGKAAPADPDNLKRFEADCEELVDLVTEAVKQYPTHESLCGSDDVSVAKSEEGNQFIFRIQVPDEFDIKVFKGVASAIKSACLFDIPPTAATVVVNPAPGAPEKELPPKVAVESVPSATVQNLSGQGSADPALTQAQVPPVLTPGQFSNQQPPSSVGASTTTATGSVTWAPKNKDQSARDIVASVNLKKTVPLYSFGLDSQLDNITDVNCAAYTYKGTRDRYIAMEVAGTMPHYNQILLTRTNNIRQTLQGCESGKYLAKALPDIADRLTARFKNPHAVFAKPCVCALLEALEVEVSNNMHPIDRAAMNESLKRLVIGFELDTAPPTDILHQTASDPTGFEAAMKERLFVSTPDHHALMKGSCVSFEVSSEPKGDTTAGGFSTGKMVDFMQKQNEMFALMQKQQAEITKQNAEIVKFQQSMASSTKTLTTAVSKLQGQASNKKGGQQQQQQQQQQGPAAAGAGPDGP